MASIKDVQRFSHRLNLLYIEDNLQVREETAALFIPLFASVDLAADGVEGLEAYNRETYDLIITDINMPRLNGIEMIEKIREINPEQKIVAISAHDESVILLDLIRRGVNSFILKPINLDDMLNVLYPVCRDADTQLVNLELFEKLREERNKLQKALQSIDIHRKTVEIKNTQLAKMSAKNSSNDYLKEYFAQEEEQGAESITFLDDDAEELKYLLLNLPDELTQYAQSKESVYLTHSSANVSKIGRLLFHYTPFLDPLAENLTELAEIMQNNPKFASLMIEQSDTMLSLFDAVCIDLRLYVHRFTQESMAMRNIHHIHEPTSLSIRQIIQLLTPLNNEECGDLELF